MSTLASLYFKTAQALAAMPAMSGPASAGGRSPVAAMLRNLAAMDDQALNQAVQSYAGTLGPNLAVLGAALDEGTVDGQELEQLFSRLDDTSVQALNENIDPEDFATLARHLSEQVISRFEGVAPGQVQADPTPVGDTETPGAAEEDIEAEVIDDPAEAEIGSYETPPGPAQEERPWDNTRGLLPDERQTLDSFYDQIRQTEEVEAPDEISGFDAAPNQWVNARDTQGNWYRVDDAGRTYRFDQTGATPQEQWTRMSHLDTLGRGEEWDQAFSQDVERRVNELVNQQMTHGRAPTGMSQSDWMDQLRQQARPQAERAARTELKSDGARSVGLGYIGDLQDTFGRVHFRQSDGRPFIQTMDGMQPVDSRELWRAQNPQAAHNHERWMREREQQMYDPRWIAGQMRAYQAAGEQMPDHLQQHIQELRSHPQFAQQVDAHQQAMGQMGQMQGQQGVNYTELYNQALSGAAQPQPSTPAQPSDLPEAAPNQSPYVPDKPDDPHKPRVPKPGPQLPEQKLAARAPKFRGNRRNTLPAAVSDNPMRRRIVPGSRNLGRSARINQALAPQQNFDPDQIQRLQDRLRARNTGPLAQATTHNTQAITQQTDYGQMRDRGMLGRQAMAGPVPMRGRPDPMGSWGRPVFQSRFRLRGM